MASSPIELDEILRQITRSYSNIEERGRVATVNRQFRDNVTITRAQRAAAVMGSAMTRYRLTHFPPITSMDQKIREIVPPIWILFTAMSNHATAEGRREGSARHIGARYDTPEMAGFNGPPPPPGMTMQQFRRIQSEGYIYIQYVFHPDKTLRQYFQEIANKVRPRQNFDVTQFFSPALGQTGPELLSLTFSIDDLGAYGW